MSRIRVVSVLAVALIAMSAAQPALAGKGHHHGHSHGSVSFGFVFGGPWYYPGYYYPPYPYYYPQPVAVRTEPTVYIERGDASEERGSQGYWYYCKESKAYHPYVKHCPGGWEKQVPASAPAR